MTTSSRQTIFERYGGFATVSKVVVEFYDRILDSPLTSPYFENRDMRRLIDHQTKFIASVMDGPASYSHEHLEAVHRHLNITDEAFAEALALLSETLEDHGLEAADVRSIREKVTSLKPYIVVRG